MARSPLSLSTKTLLTLALALVALLVGATALAWRARQREQAKVQRTLAALAAFKELIDTIPMDNESRSGSTGEGRDPTGQRGLAGDVEGFGHELDRFMNEHAEVIDGWGEPLLYRRPGRVHPTGWDLYSVGPNSVDEHGGGDDIVVGEDAPVVPRWKLPLGGFAGAREGDWCAYLCSLTDTSQDGVANHDEPGLRTIVVTRTGPSAVSWLDERFTAPDALTPQRHATTREASTKGPLDFELLFLSEAPLGTRFKGDLAWTTTEEELELAGHTFDCKKLTTTTDHPAQTWELWFSPDVTGVGLVRLRRRGKQAMRDEDVDSVLELLLAGCGTKGETRSGRSLEELTTERVK